jgi:hypothetical protein
MTLTRKALAAIAMGAVIGAVIAPALSATESFAAAATPAATAAPAPVATGHVYATKIGKVHVRSLPNNSTGSHILATLGTAGTKVTVTCVTHVTTAGVTHSWYRMAKPLGYIAGRNLVLPPHQVTGLPACK